MPGSILILCAISELLSEEIKHIKGSALSLKIFVGVALAAVIRKVVRVDNPIPSDFRFGSSILAYT